MRMHNRLLATGIATLLFGLVTHAARALEISEIFAGDFSVTQSASGIPVTFPGKAYIGADLSFTAAPVVRVHAVVDLSDLQRKIPAIIATIKLPSDNCGSYSPKNAVVTLSDPSLSFANNEALFHTGGSADIWECLENPVPNSKLDWEIRNVGLGIKTKVPVVHTWPGNPIKTKLGTQPFSVDAPFGLRIVDAGAIQLVPGEAKLNLSGQYVDLTKAILNAFKVDLSSKLNDAIQKALDPKKATASIPPEFIAAGFAFQEAKFVQYGNNLGLDVSANMKITASAAKEMAKLLFEAIKSKL